MQHRQSWCLHVLSKHHKTHLVFTNALIDLSSPQDNEEFFTIVCLFSTVVNIMLLQNMSGLLRYQKE